LFTTEAVAKNFGFGMDQEGKEGFGPEGDEGILGKVFRKTSPENNNNCLFHLYPPVTRKRLWRYVLDESAPTEELSIFEFFGCLFDYVPLYLLLVRSHQAEIIIVKHLIQGRINVRNEGGS